MTNFLVLFLLFCLSSDGFLTGLRLQVRRSDRIRRQSSRLFIKDNWWVNQIKENAVDLDDPAATSELLQEFILNNFDDSEDATTNLKKLIRSRFREDERKTRKSKDIDRREALYTTIREEFSIQQDNFEEISRYYGLSLDYLGEFACLRGVSPPINITQPIKEFLSGETIVELMEILHAYDPLTMNLDYVSKSIYGISREYCDYPIPKLIDICARERIMLPYGENTIVNKHNYQRICNFLNIEGVRYRLPGEEFPYSYQEEDDDAGRDNNSDDVINEFQEFLVEPSPPSDNEGKQNDPYNEDGDEEDKGDEYFTRIGSLKD